MTDHLRWQLRQTSWTAKTVNWRANKSHSATCMAPSHRGCKAASCVPGVSRWQQTEPGAAHPALTPKDAAVAHHSLSLFNMRNVSCLVVFSWWSHLTYQFEIISNDRQRICCSGKCCICHLILPNNLGSFLTTCVPAMHSGLSQCSAQRTSLRLFTQHSNRQLSCWRPTFCWVHRVFSVLL